MIHRIQIKQRTPLHRSIRPFLLNIFRSPLQKINRPLVLVFRRILESIPQQISNISSSAIKLAVSVILKSNLINNQLIGNEQPVRLLQNRNFFKTLDRPHKNQHSVFNRNLEILNTSTPHRHYVLNQSNLFMNSATHIIESKLDKHYFHPQVSVMMEQGSIIRENSDSVNCLKESTITRFISSEFAVTNLKGRERGIINAERTQMFKSNNIGKFFTVDMQKMVSNPYFMVIKKSNNRAVTKSINFLLKSYKGNKKIEHCIHYLSTQTSTKDLKMNTSINSSSDINGTVTPVRLDYQQKQKPALVQQQGGLRKKIFAPSPSIDIDRITEDVMRKINSKIRIEKERRGLL